MTAASLAFVPVAALAVAGFLFGLLYFAAVHRTARLVATGQGWAAPLAFTLGRLALAGAFLAFAAKLGAAALLSALCGFLLARTLALRNVGSTN